MFGDILRQLFSADSRADCHNARFALVGWPRVRRGGEYVTTRLSHPHSYSPVAPTVYANSLLVTLNSRHIVRDGFSSKQSTSTGICYTVPLSRIMPHDPQLGRSLDGSSNTKTDTISEAQKATKGDCSSVAFEQDLNYEFDPCRY